MNKDNYDFQDIINKLDLIPLPEEGGFYKETFRSKRLVQSSVLGSRTECTCIYYLITEDSFSALHLVDQDEIFHFYGGSPAEMFQFDLEGNSQIITMGSDLFNNECPQVIVPHNTWQGTKLKDPKPGAWALLGCTVAPGFELENFHIKSRQDLIHEFPLLEKDIIRYTNKEL
jgi:predicted cupin superfamily sugar epimerase